MNVCQINETAKVVIQLNLKKDKDAITHNARFLLSFFFSYFIT